ncbi:MAG: hypothetical protein ABW179_07510 [Methylobacterium sp.]
MSLSPDHRRDLNALRANLAGLTVETKLLRIGWLLSRKYDPAQPREPAGQPGGGRWTSDGSTDAGSLADRDDPATTGSIGSDPAASTTQEEVVTADGSRVLTIRVRSNSQTDRLTDWDEQHVVTAPDGISTIIENDGSTQTIRDGDTGEILGRNTWTPNGVSADAFVQQARGPGSVQRVARTIEALGTYFVVQSARNGRDGTAIFDAPASSYKPANDTALPPIWVGRVDQRELDAACPRNGEVQALADEAAAEIKALSNYASPQDFGSKVHASIAKKVRAMNDPDFIAETSFMRSGGILSSTGRGSLKLDLLERSVPLTVCVYDHKTGESGLSAPRAADLAEAVQRNFPGTLRMIVIEIRPRP